MGRDESDDDTETARRYVGALLFAAGLQELTNIRKLLTAKPTG